MTTTVATFLPSSLSLFSFNLKGTTFRLCQLFAVIAMLSACQSGGFDHANAGAPAEEEMMAAAMIESPMVTPNIGEAGEAEPTEETVAANIAPASPTETIDLTFKNFKDKDGHAYTRQFWGREQDPLFGKFEKVTLTHNGKSMLELDCERESMYGKSMLISVQLPTQVDQPPPMMRVLTSQLTYMEGSFVNYEDDPYDFFYFKNGQLIDLVRQDGHDASNRTSLFEQLEADSLASIANNLLREVSTLLFFNNKITNFSGDWSHVKNSDDYRFSTHLQQVGEFVFGTYCGYTPTRYDCELESQGGSPCFVMGRVGNDTLRLKFNPCYTEGTGEAKLFFNSGEMVWQTLHHPEGFSTVPSDGRLQQ